MKTVYRNNPDTITGIRIVTVPDDYQLQAGETFDPPADDLNIPYQIKTDGSWVGGTAEQTAAALAGHKSTQAPTNEQQAITALAQQIADGNASTESHIKSIEQAITALATGGNA